jgi:hypothetical protein
MGESSDPAVRLRGKEAGGRADLEREEKLALFGWVAKKEKIAVHELG